MGRSRRPGIKTLTILLAVSEGRRYGLDLVSRTGLPSGTVYPVLGRLLRRGWVRGRWEDQRIADREGRPRRKYYEVTQEGRAVLAKGNPLHDVPAVERSMRLVWFYAP